jgi:hypothetical protein
MDKDKHLPSLLQARHWDRRWFVDRSSVLTVGQQNQYAWFGSLFLLRRTAVPQLGAYFLCFFSLDSTPLSEPGFSCTLQACNHCIRYLGRHQLSYLAALSTTRLACECNFKPRTEDNHLRQSPPPEIKEWTSPLLYHQCIITKIDSIALSVLRTASRAPSTASNGQRVLQYVSSLNPCAAHLESWITRSSSYAIGPLQTKSWAVYRTASTLLYYTCTQSMKFISPL